jgi:hypothetical protein
MSNPSWQLGRWYQSIFLLPWGWIKEIKPVLPVHGLFLTWTQNLIIRRSYITIFTHKIRLASTQPLATHCPLFFICHLSFLLPAFLLTWRTSFLARGATTHPLLSLVCYQLPTLCCSSHPNTPHRSSYNIYIDHINNISHPRLTQ